MAQPVKHWLTHPGDLRLDFQHPHQAKASCPRSTQTHISNYFRLTGWSLQPARSALASLERQQIDGLHPIRSLTRCRPPQRLYPQGLSLCPVGYPQSQSASGYNSCCLQGVIAGRTGGSICAVSWLWKPSTLTPALLWKWVTSFILYSTPGL